VSDTTAHDLAIELRDWFDDATHQIDAPCDIDRIVVTPGRPAVEGCNEIAVWVSNIAPTAQPTVESTADGNGRCPVQTYVELSWRLSTCTTITDDSRTPIPAATHLADAECFDVWLFGLYRRLAIDAGDGRLFDVAGCALQSFGAVTTEDRGGGRVTASQVLRVSVELTRPTS
jgi:hypothetical protein